MLACRPLIDGKREPENYCKAFFSINNNKLFFEFVAKIISQRIKDQYITAENIVTGTIDYLNKQINNNIIQSVNSGELIESIENQSLDDPDSLAWPLLPQLISDSFNTIVNIIVIRGESIIHHIMYLPNENDPSNINSRKGLLELFYDSLTGTFVDNFGQNQESHYYLTGEHLTSVGDETYF